MQAEKLVFPMGWAALYGMWADDRYADHRVYGHCPHGTLNAVMALHYSLIADHERAQALALEQVA